MSISDLIFVHLNNRVHTRIQVKSLVGEFTINFFETCSKIFLSYQDRIVYSYFKMI